MKLINTSDRTKWEFGLILTKRLAMVLCVSKSFKDPWWRNEINQVRMLSLEYKRFHNGLGIHFYTFMVGVGLITAKKR